MFLWIALNNWAVCVPVYGAVFMLSTCFSLELLLSSTESLYTERVIVLGQIPCLAQWRALGKAAFIFTQKTIWLIIMPSSKTKTKTKTAPQGDKQNEMKNAWWSFGVAKHMHNINDHLQKTKVQKVVLCLQIAGFLLHQTRWNMPDPPSVSKSSCSFLSV